MPRTDSARVSGGVGFADSHSKQASVFDPDQVPLSTSEGERPSSSAGDRMMVGLAVLALLGGLLIVLSRLVPDAADQTSRATATPVATATEASPTPLPSLRPPPARTMTVDPGPIATPREDGSIQIAEWVRLRTAVTLVSDFTSAAQPTGRLQAGDAAYVSEVAPQDAGGASGWLLVDGPLMGWIFGDIDNAAMFERFPYRGPSYSEIYGLTPDADGFTAFGWTGNRQTALTSADGTHWRAAGTPTPAISYGRSIANGPAGWLMAGTIGTDTGQTPMIWSSADARSWEPLGSLPEDLGGGIQTLVGTEAGYVLFNYSGAASANVWYSADGVLWTERPLAGLAGDMGIRLVATPLGFYVWGLGDPSAHTTGAFSVDGWTWTESAFIGPSEVLDVVADGDHLLAMGRGPDGTRMWTGAVDGGQLTWSSDNTAPFRMAAVSRMVTDGARVVALGWDRGSESLLWWQRTGLSWQQHAMPSAFTGIPYTVAGGPMGIVAVSRVDHAGGSQSVLWHLGQGVVWEPEPDPVMPAPSDPSAQSCGPRPHDLLGLLNTDQSWAARCFGNTSITVRGWSVACEGCYQRLPGMWRKEWLAQPADNRVIHLAPLKTSDWGALDAVLHPSLRARPPLSRWLEVTGHYDDPEAAACHWTPNMADEVQFTGTADVVTRCRSQFVVTAVRPVGGP